MYLSVIGESISIVESEWSIETATQNTKLDNFRKVGFAADGKRLYCKVIVRIVDRFLKLNNIGWNDDQLFTCAIDIMERCITWNIADIVCFLKYLRQNPKNLKELRIYANFTPTDLMRMIPFYNEEQALVLEERKKKQVVQENEVIRGIVQIETPDGIKQVPWNKIVTKITNGMDSKPKNEFEKAVLQHSIKKEHEEALKPDWQKRKEKLERQQKIATAANKLGKKEDSKKKDGKG